MSILDIFRTQTPAAPAASAAPAVPTTQQQQQLPVPPATPGAPGTVATPNANDPLAFRAGKPGEGETPLANFAELWKIDDNNKPVDTVTALSPTFNIDPTKVADAAKSIDYGKLVTPEAVQKALGGDTAAFTQILNSVAQAATANAGINAAKITEAALASQAKRFAEVMPAEMRRFSVNQQVSQDHAIFSNPATAPIMEGLTKQFTLKYPNATPQQISEYTKAYLADFVKVVGGQMPDPALQQQQQQQQAGETDWSKFFG